MIVSHTRGRSNPIASIPWCPTRHSSPTRAARGLGKVRCILMTGCARGGSLRLGWLNAHPFDGPVNGYAGTRQ